MLNFRMAEVIPKNPDEGMHLYNSIKEKEKDKFKVSIPARTKERWGVIRGWEWSISELLEDVKPGQGSFTSEWLTKRVKTKERYEWQKTNNLLIKFERDSLPTKLIIYV